MKITVYRNRDVHVVYILAVHVQDLDVDIESKQETDVLLGSSSHIYRHRNTASTNGTCLEICNFPISVSSFIIRRTKVVNSVCAALSMEATVIVVVLILHAAANFFALSVNGHCRKHTHILINGP